MKRFLSFLTLFLCLAIGVIVAAKPAAASISDRIPLSQATVLIYEHGGLQPSRVGFYRNGEYGEARVIRVENGVAWLWPGP